MKQPKVRSGNKKRGLKLGRGRDLAAFSTPSGDLLRSSSPASSVTSHISRVTFRSTDLEEDTALEYGFTTEDSVSHYSNSDYESSEEGDENDVTARIPITECIYCGKKYREIETNIRHMFKHHGLYIPERSYLQDLQGLLNHLIDIILIKKQCMCCSYQGSSLESIRAHMNSKHHCMLPYETKAERSAIAAFYDFSSLEDPNGESKNSDQIEGSTELEQVDNSETEETHNEEGAMNSNFALVHVDETGVELTLGNGTRLGHRSMQRYYRQNLPLGSAPTDDQRTIVAADGRINSILPSRQLQRAEKTIKQLEKQHSNKNIRLQIRRSNNQTHFRDELLQ